MATREELQEKIDLDCYNMRYADIKFDYWTARHQLFEHLEEAKKLGFDFKEVNEFKYELI